MEPCKILRVRQVQSTLGAKSEIYLQTANREVIGKLDRKSSRVGGQSIRRENSEGGRAVREGRETGGCKIKTHLVVVYRNSDRLDGGILSPRSGK